MRPGGRTNISSYRPETTSAVTWLVCALTGSFLLQFALESRWLSSTTQTANVLALTPEGLGSGRFWSFLTYWLVHSTGNLLHLGLVLAGLILIGRQLERERAPRTVLLIFFTGILCGAMAWAAANWSHSGNLTGSTSGVYALLSFYALGHPRKQIELLLFFFFPITFRPRHLLACVLVIDIFAFLLFEVFRQPLPFSYAPSAHLAGALSGWLYFLAIKRVGPSGVEKMTFHDRETQRSDTQLADTERCHRDSASARQLSPSEIRGEIDRILDKINSHGLSSLSPAERKILDGARETINRH